MKDRRSGDEIRPGCRWNRSAPHPEEGRGGKRHHDRRETEPDHAKAIDQTDHHRDREHDRQRIDQGCIGAWTMPARSMPEKPIVHGTDKSSPPVRITVLRAAALFAAAALMMVACLSAAKSEKARVFEGPNACIECHKQEGEIWQKTHHFTTFRQMPRSQEARDIAKKMGIRRIKADSTCLACHFSTQKVKGRNRVVAGISCESCHGAGQKFIELHSGFSGKKDKASETAREAKARWAKSEARGMIRPANIYKLAKNCIACHVVPQEKLVNVGGHPAGSNFELVSWSQGEVRHNVWHSKGKTNSAADRRRQRIMFVAGLGVELESALRAVAVATKRQTYAFKMARRVADARDKIAAIAKALPAVKEFGRMLKASKSAWLRLNNKRPLEAAADAVARETLSIIGRHDGSQLAAIDGFLPPKSKYRGQASK